MSVVSCETGHISLDNGSTVVASVRNIRFSPTINSQRATASGQDPGVEFGVAGRSDWTCSFDFFGKTIVALPGAAVTVIGYTGAERITGTGLVSEISLECDIEGGNMLSGSCSLGANSALDYAAGSALADANVPAAFQSIGCKAAWGPIAASPTMADIADVRRWSFTARCELRPYGTSDTGAFTKRLPGNRSIEAEVTTYNANPTGYETALMLPGNFGELRLYVDATTFYAVRWMEVQASESTLPIEQKGSMEFAHRFRHSLYGVVSGSQTRGYFKLPSGTNIWP